MKNVTLHGGYTMTRQGRLEYLRSIFDRYNLARRAAKGPILDEFCRVSGYNRKYAIRLLNGPLPKRRPRTSSREPTYGPELIRILVGVWKSSGYPCSIRLKALLSVWLPWVRQHYAVGRRLEQDLLAISARQIDRRLKDHKRELKKRIFGRTKPGTLLKHQIPVKVGRWRTRGPGYSEVDLVSHSGECAEGEFINSFNLTDIHTTWVETRAVMGKSQVRMKEALEDIRKNLPFRLRGIDSDNGGEFINAQIWDYCRENSIQFTRGRPYKKDDNAHIEQKNWTHVRKLMGYVRYETPEALTAMNKLYRGELRTYQNLFLPSMKLVRKQRVGSRVRRLYDAPQTPLERVIASGQGDPMRLAELKSLRDRIDPFELSKSIDRQLERIYAMAGGRRKASSKFANSSVPGHPWRTPPERRVTSLMAQR